MTYVVTVDICLPQGTPEMDPLQRAGAVALIEDGFDSVEAVEGPDGMEADLFDSIVAVHPAGALLKVFVDAPVLESAEDAVRSVVADLLERSQLLADWRIDRCEVELHPKLAQESLDAADGPDAPPADPAARKAHHAQRPTEDEDEEPYDPEAKAATVKAQMLTLSQNLKAFPPTVFGAPDNGEAGETGETGGGGDGGAGPEPGRKAGGPEAGQEAGGPEAGQGGAQELQPEEVAPAAVAPAAIALAAGALLYATDILVDELFQDVQTLTQEDTTAANCDGPLWHFEDLPERYALQYDARFARRFLVTVIAMTTRFTDGSFQRPSCVAEELALKLLLTETHVTLETFGLLTADVAKALDAFADHVYEDSDHDWLYDGAMDDLTTAPLPGATSEAFKAWFTPFEENGYIHPSATGEPEQAA
ncbi:hypothetical protein RM863_38640 [Streptomyces sp. DSM 41014]|uniref:Uncharacterized protein n=1 Tax=Streptomyces hintoniae TaxID=3075521 RepID=A0ABU2UXP3_9ACTN|nr:hypothetical protein [Streptomyces sp. DSM 41014]MDT0478050.1 hypothetical protein [Streptomyces sp. DSM 41014]